MGARQTLRRTARYLRGEAELHLRDLTDLVLRRRDPLVPPRRLMFDGPRDPQIFKRSGREYLGHYIDVCGLRPHEHMLDVGCGIGRKTVPLTGYLEPQGRYLGLDVNPTGVAWCRSRIKARHPNFEFHHIDVFHRRYNPKGTLEAPDYRFPADDESFDFVVLASVFTHMFPDGVERYLSETARVLKTQGGRCLISYFLLNRETQEFIDAGKSDYEFPFRKEGFAYERRNQPEDVVGYGESLIYELYAKAGLRVQLLHPGSWCGRGSCLSYQDLIVARKEEAPAR